MWLWSVSPFAGGSCLRVGNLGAASCRVLLNKLVQSGPFTPWPLRPLRWGTAPARPPSLDLRCESLFVDSTSPPTTTSVLTKTGKTEMRHLTDLENSRSRKTPVSRNKGCSKKSSVATMGDMFFSAAGRDVLADLHSKHAAWRLLVYPTAYYDTLRSFERLDLLCFSPPQLIFRWRDHTASQ